MKLILLWTAFISRSVAAVAAQDAAIAKLGEYCSGDLPGYIPQLKFAPLDNPPEGASDWKSFFQLNAKRIIDQVKKENDTNFMLLPDPELSEEYPDAYGSNKNQLFLETEEELRAAFDIKDAAINLKWLHTLEGSTIQQSLDLLGDAIGRRPNVTDFYISQPGAGSYGWHFDSDDGIVYLVEGNKHFRVAGTEVGSPTTIDVFLQPGDAIYIPAKYYHYATGGDEQSVIWSMGFTNTKDDFFDLEEKGGADFELLEEETWEEIAARRAREEGVMQQPEEL